jgi:hypothetical protein
MVKSRVASGFSLLVIGGPSGFLGNYRLPGEEQTHLFFDT